MISEPPGLSTVMIEIDGLRKSYGVVQAVKGVSLRVERGQAQFIIGPSGCGKSTLLRCINLLEEPDAGRMRIGDTRFEFDGRANPGQGRRRGCARMSGWSSSSSTSSHI